MVARSVPLNRLLPKRYKDQRRDEDEKIISNLDELNKILFFVIGKNNNGTVTEKNFLVLEQFILEHKFEFEMWE